MTENTVPEIAKLEPEPMNAAIKAKWVGALRSGEYKQAKGVLHDNVGFCCLGVLCDIHRKETNSSTWVADTSDNDEDCLGYLGEVCILPVEVRAWAGFQTYSSNPTVRIYGKCSSSLAQLNDNGNDFKTIADLIENQL
jgi:hypothetical protein